MSRELMQITNALRGRRLSLQNEKRLQQEIEKALTENGIAHEREVHLNDESIVDFMVGSIAVEVKIKTKANAMSIYRQMERYAEFEQVETLLLITGRTLSLPDIINNKPVYMMTLSRTQL